MSYDKMGCAMRTALPQDSPATDSAVITKATLRAADRLRVTNKVLAKVIGVSESTVSRMRKGDYPLEKGQKPFELAVMFVRLYRSLDAVVGGDDAVASQWLANANTALSGVPLNLIQSVSGLANVIQYLDARRAVV
jgi:DNA-binding XRE family transcriptional regulator